MNHIICLSLLLFLFISDSLQTKEALNNKKGNHKKPTQNLRRIQSLDRSKIRIVESKGGKGKNKTGKKAYKKSSKKGKNEMKGEKKKGKKGKKGKSIPQKCIIQPPITVDNYNDGTCDQLLNTKECKYDGHDCDDFNNAYPNCKVDNPKFVGDKYCDGAMYNTTECGYDGGDCVDNSGTTFGCSGAMNGYCENEYNIPECGYDGGDCDKFNSLYPKCKVPDPSFVGDGLCDIAPYNTAECGYDGGDCKNFPVNCTVTDTYAIGDGVCNVEFNTTDCAYDGGDCLS